MFAGERLSVTLTKSGYVSKLKGLRFKGASVKHYWIAASILLSLGCGDADTKSNNANNANNANNVQNNTNNVQNNTNNVQNNANNANNGFDPGVATDTPSNQLSDEDRTQICQNLGEFTDALGLPASNCIFSGYGAAESTGSMDADELRQACQESYDLCVMQTTGRPAGGNFCSPAANCSGSVEQGVACVIDAAQGQISATAELPGCDAITFDSLGLTATIQLPPSAPCAQLNATCE